MILHLGCIELTYIYLSFLIVVFTCVCLSVLFIVLCTDEVMKPISMADFRRGAAKVNKSVSATDIDRYQKWMDEFRRTLSVVLFVEM